MENTTSAGSFTVEAEIPAEVEPATVRAYNPVYMDRRGEPGAVPWRATEHDRRGRPLTFTESNVIPDQVLDAMRARDRDPRFDQRPRSDFLR